MAKLWHTKITPSSFAATEAASGYPASNVGLQSLARPWRSTTTGFNEVQINFPVATSVQVLHLHDVNFPSATIQKAVSGGIFVNVGALTTYTDENGRRRGYITINEPLCTSLKIQISSGAPTDSLTYWRIGASYAFQTVITLPYALQFGYEIDSQEAILSTELANKQVAEARAGLDKDLIKLPFDAKFSESLIDIYQRTGKGVCLFTTDLPNYPQELWPVIRQKANSPINRYAVNLARRTILLTEVV